MLHHGHRDPEVQDGVKKAKENGSQGQKRVEEQGTEHSHHRSPMNVLLDLAHKNPEPDTPHTHHKSNEERKVDSARSPERPDPSKEDRAERSHKRRSDVKNASSETRPPQKVASRPTPLVAPWPLSRDVRHKHKTVEPDNTLVSEEPDSGKWLYPDSSPSIYSQEDVNSEGTVDSDEEARELLAHADSGPARKPAITEIKDEMKQKPADEQVDRAKKVVLGEKGSK